VLMDVMGLAFQTTPWLPSIFHLEIHHERTEQASVTSHATEREKSS
jgi:hypothetical protein